MLKKKKQLNLKFIIMALLLSFACTLFISCEKGANLYAFKTETFFLENSRGAYTYGEIVVPETDDSYPLVFIAHGFTGTLNSGGAKELSERLASEGIAAIRIDFNSYASDSRSSGKTDEYTLGQMQQDGVLAIEYAIDNYNVDTESVGIYGRSMGGRVAMMMANENVEGYDFKAMTLIAPAGNDNAMVYYMGGEEKWEDMKEEALAKGYCLKQGLKLRYEWFTEFEEYNPAEHGAKFGDKPVLVFYNTLDKVVLPATSLECAAAYSNVEIVEVTTEDGHGYEMSFEESPIKDRIMDKIVEFFIANL